jgi:hypothetical protein
MRNITYHRYSTYSVKEGARAEGSRGAIRKGYRRPWTMGKSGFLEGALEDWVADNWTAGSRRTPNCLILETAWRRTARSRYGWQVLTLDSCLMEIHAP